MFKNTNYLSTNSYKRLFWDSVSLSQVMQCNKQLFLHTAASTSSIRLFIVIQINSYFSLFITSSKL